MQKVSANQPELQFGENPISSSPERVKNAHPGKRWDEKAEKMGMGRVGSGIVEEVQFDPLSPSDPLNPKLYTPPNSTKKHFVSRESMSR